MSGHPGHSPDGATAFKLTRTEALELLRGEPVGRICVGLHGYPVAFPVNYVVDETIDGSRVVVRTAPHTAVGSYHGPASLEVDRIDLASGRAWSVIVRGELVELAGRRPNEDPRPFVSDRRTRWMELVIVAVDGRRFVADHRRFAVDWQLEPAPPSRARETASRALTSAITSSVVAGAAHVLGETAHRLHTAIAPPGSTE